MANNASEVISYVEDGNGKLVRSPARRRSPAENIHEEMYVSDENGDLVPYVPPPRRFTQKDRERADQSRTRYTRSKWCRTLLDFAEGKVSMSKQQFQAHLVYGRSRGWHLPRQ